MLGHALTAGLCNQRGVTRRIEVMATLYQASQVSSSAARHVQHAALRHMHGKIAQSNGTYMSYVYVMARVHQARQTLR